MNIFIFFDMENWNEYTKETNENAHKFLVPQVGYKISSLCVERATLKTVWAKLMQNKT